MLRLIKQCLFLHVRRGRKLAASWLNIYRNHFLNNFKLCLRHFLNGLDIFGCLFLLRLHSLLRDGLGLVVGSGLMIRRLLHIWVIWSLYSVLILTHKLWLHRLVKCVVIVLVRFSIHFIFRLRDHLNVCRVHLHVRRPVIKDGWRHNRHRIGQLTTLLFSVREAAVDPEFAVAADLEVLAELGLVVAMKHSNKLLTREILGHRLKMN